MKKILLPLTLLLITGLTTGCGPRNLEPGAESVSIKPNFAYISKTCKFLGEISGNDVHGNMSLTSSSEDLRLDDINFLKNKGKTLGANVVVFKQHQLVNEQRSTGGKNHHTITVTEHNVIGDAYRCPTDSMSTLKVLMAEQIRL